MKELVDTGATRSRWPAAVTGFGFFVLTIVAVFMDEGPPDGASPAAITRYFMLNHNDIEMQAALFALGSALLLVFAAWIGARAVASDPALRPLAYVIGIGAVGTIGFFLLGEAAWMVVSHCGCDPDANFGDTAVTFTIFRDFGYEARVMANFPAGLFALASGLALLWSASNLRAVGWLGLLLGTFMLVNGAIQVLSVDGSDLLGDVALLGFLVWVLLQSVVLVAEPGVQARPAGALGPA